MFGHREPSREEIACRADELYLQRGSEQGKLSKIGLEPKEPSDEPVAGIAKTKVARQAIAELIDVGV